MSNVYVYPEGESIYSIQLYGKSILWHFAGFDGRIQT